MKRVVPFLDMYDKIPSGAKYLFSKKIEFDLRENEEDKTKRIISGIDDKKKGFLYHHYYEIEEIDFERLVRNNYMSEEPRMKINKLMKLVEKLEQS